MAAAGIVWILNILSGAVALLVSYYAYKNNKILGNPLLRYISIGFLILGASLLLEAGVESLARITPVEASKVRGTELAAFLIYTALQFIAYLVFAWGYVLSSLRRPGVGSSPEGPVASPAAGAGLSLVSPLATVRAIALTTFVLTIYLVSQLGIVILLFFIAYHGVLVFTKTKSNLALMVLFGFVLILAAHILLFGAGIFTSSGLQVIGDTIQFCGFVALLFFLYWSGRVVG